MMVRTCIMLMAAVVIGTAITAAASSLRKRTNGGGVILPTSTVNDDKRVDGDNANDNSRETSLTMTTSHYSHHHGGSSYHPNDNSNSNNKVGDFDFYVYTMSYQPEFCYESKEQYAGCHSYNKIWEGQLTIHGLWPNRNDGSYPTQCSHDKLLPAHLAGLESSMEQKWPNVKSPTTSSSYQSWSMSDTSFWSHEWDKHGTCSNMDQHTYFHTALQLLLPTPTIIKERYDSISDDGSGGVVTRSELIAGYATSSSNDISSYLKEEKETVLVCSKSGYLSEVRVCYEKKKTMTTYNSAKDGENGSGGSSSSSSSSSSGNGNVGKRITCPNVILKEDNCGETIKLASFNEHKSNVADIYL